MINNGFTRWRSKSCLSAKCHRARRWRACCSTNLTRMNGYLVWLRRTLDLAAIGMFLYYVERGLLLDILKWGGPAPMTELPSSLVDLHGICRSSNRQFSAF